MILPGLHDTHRATLLPVMGSLYGCTTCWRIVGYRCGDVTTLGGLACVANDAVSEVVERVWRGVATPAVFSISAENLRAALRGNGGRHASGH